MKLRPLGRRLAFSLLATLLGLGLLEGGMRTVLPLVAPGQHYDVLMYRHRWFPRWDPSPIFQPHPYVAYVHSPDGEFVNGDGFTSPELPRVKPPGVVRIAALGGSTTDGPRSWPHHLARELHRAHPELEVQALNFGMSGWTSAESAVNFVLNVQDYEPDIVIVHHAANDLGPMQHRSFHPDYRHYRKILEMDTDAQGRLRLRQAWTWRFDAWMCRHSLFFVWLRMRLLGEGRSQYSLVGLTTRSDGAPVAVPAEVRARPFQRNLRSIGRLAEANGSRVLFATIPWVREASAPELTEGWGEDLRGELAAQNTRLLEVARQEGWGALDLDALMGDIPELYVDPIHLEQEGEIRKARHIAAWIEAAGWLAPPAPPPPAAPPAGAP